MSTARTVCRSSCGSIPCPHPIRLAALSTWQATGIKAATPVGNLFGQLIFGWLADVLGRKRMCKYTTLDRPSAIQLYLSRWH
jgi:MFS family permease